MVDANGDWTCTVPAADLSGLKDGDASVQVSVTNVNGNAASSSQAFSVDTAAPAVTINTISGDNMLNAAEAAQDLTLWDVPLPKQQDSHHEPSTAISTPPRCRRTAADAGRSGSGSGGDRRRQRGDTVTVSR